MENPFDVINDKLDRIESLLDKQSLPPIPIEKELMTRTETMSLLGMKQTSLWRMTRDGVFQSYKLGSRVMYKRSEVMAALETMKA